VAVAEALGRTITNFRLGPIRGLDAFMFEILHRMYENFAGRLTGPMQFRLYLQPAMAMYFGIRDGLKDFRQHQPPYFWSLFTTPGRGWRLIKNGLGSVGRVMVFAVIMDAIYQYIELKWFYVGEAILVAFVLAFLPYLLIRGPVNRIAKWRASKQ
jgi:hypothetical protein